MSIIRALHTACLATAVWIMPAANVYGQSVEQSFQLQSGWNAVYLEVDPRPSDAEVLFADMPVAAVWARSERPQSIPHSGCANPSDPNDPACVRVRDSGWRVWLPPSNPHHVVSTLRVIRGGRVYLIQATAPTTMTVVGKPVASSTQWRRGYNLVGFHVTEDPQAVPSFASYLAASPALRNAAVHEINADGTFSPVTDVANTRIAPGRGYWVKASRNTVYDGPLKIDNRSLRGISLAPGVVEHAIRIENLAPSDSSVTITNIPSCDDPNSGSPSSGNGVPLVYLRYGDGGEAESFRQWPPLQNETWPLAAAGQAGSTRMLRVAVNRAELRGAGQGNSSPNGQYRAVLELTD